MTEERRPAFLFYAEKYLAASRPLSLAAKGAHVDLLAYSWHHDVPTGDDELRRLAGADRAEWKAIWREIQGRWIEQDGRLVNPELEQVRHETARFSDDAKRLGQMGGKRSVESRRQKYGNAQPPRPEAAQYDRSGSEAVRRSGSTEAVRDDSSGSASATASSGSEAAPKPVSVSVSVNPSSSLRSEEGASLPADFKLHRERAQQGRKPRQVAPDSPEAFRDWFYRDHAEHRGPLLEGNIRTELGQIKGLFDDLRPHFGDETFRQAQRMATAMFRFEDGEWPGPGSRGIGLLVSSKCRQRWLDAVEATNDGIPRDRHGKPPPYMSRPDWSNDDRGLYPHLNEDREWVYLPEKPAWFCAYLKSKGAHDENLGGTPIPAWNVENPLPSRKQA